MKFVWGGSSSQIRSVIDTGCCSCVWYGFYGGSVFTRISRA
uniref:Predicted protein n=1 Tax=Hordeum vulgare subsp. vulgare TaxID=112509 RepID=F2DA25_HORVV|nr:predicted protein [Hordeum vulgare subsp. vulgare]